MIKIYPLLSLLAAALLLAQQPATRPAPPDFDGTHQALQGGALSAEKITELEQLVAKDPADLRSRVSLLGYYFTQQTQPSGRDARRPHVMYLIENLPQWEFTGSPFCNVNHILDPTGYAAAKIAWSSQLDKSPDNRDIVRNVAQFFFNSEPELAEKYLKQGRALEPNVPEWAQQLAQLHRLQSISAEGPEQRELRLKALAESEDAYRLTPPGVEQFYMLADLSKTNLEAGRPEKAQEYARLLLEQAANYRNDWNYGNAIHQGNLMLGHIALEKGDLDLAKSHLIAAGKTTGSPQLNSFGPNMQLAQDLLAKGQRDAVLEYLKLCRAFWRSGASRLDAWSRQIEAGQKPDFGANLLY